MEMGPFISHLLFEIDKVVLPNFGEFSTNYIPARFIPEEKKIEAPRKQIKFDPAVKHGEPLVAKLIASITGADFSFVENHIDSFVGELHSKLDEGGKVMLEQIGLFSKGGQGEIIFEPDTSINYLSQSAGLEAIPAPTIASEPTSEIAAALAESKVENERSGEASGLTRTMEPVEKPEPIPTEPILEKPKSLIEPIINESKRRKSGWIWFLVAFLIMAVAIYLLLPTISKLLEPPKPEVEVVEKVPLPEAEPSPEPELDPFEAKPFIPQSGVAAYFVVVGAFPSIELAEDKAKAMRDAGGIYARPFMMTEPGYHRVSYGYFYDLQEAETELAKVRDLGFRDAYIYRHKPR